MIKIFLDDYRVPLDSSEYMYRRIGKFNVMYLEPDWVVCRTFENFKMLIIQNLPDLISWDFDLDEHPENEKHNTTEYYNGLDCLEWLANHCKIHKLKFPDFYVHSQNIGGHWKLMYDLQFIKKYNVGLYIESDLPDIDFLIDCYSEYFILDENSWEWDNSKLLEVQENYQKFKTLKNKKV